MAVSSVSGESAGVWGASPLLGRELAAALHVRGRLDDLPDEAKPPHRADHEAADVELPRLQAVERGRGEGVVVVVPRLPERDPREPPDVARLVLDAEAARADEVADRVHRPRDVVQEEDPDQAAPEHRLQPGADRSAPDPA